MDWVLSKKLVLFFLVIINIGLFVINYTQKEHYEISPLQEKNISQLLNNNGIFLSADIGINYKPMGRLESQISNYKKEDIEEAFFNGNTTEMTKTISDTISKIETIYENDEYRLSIQGTLGVFSKKNSEWTTIVTEEFQAIQLAIAEIRKLENLFGKLIQTQSYYTSEGWVIEFSGMQDDYLIYSNKFKAYVSDTGLYKIEFEYFEIVQQVEEVRDIISSDEALLSFIKYWVKYYDEFKQVSVQFDTEIDDFDGLVINANIEHVKLGYYIGEQRDLFVGTRFYMEPCYIIYLLDNTSAYLINAYTGEIIVD